MLGCGSSDSSSRSTEDLFPTLSWCAGPEAAASQDALIEAAGLETWRGEWEGGAELGATQAAEGYSIRGVRWAHPRGGEQAAGLWFEPVPRPSGPLPLLVNVHGHWDAGVEADEVLFRSELFAREGWVVLSVATRGSEQGDARTPRWRASHFEDGLYGEMRERRMGRTPLAWNVEAANRGLDLALEGKFGGGPIDRDRVGLIGISGGAEIAALLGAVEPRVGALVVGSFEYAFGTQEGGASCSCGAVTGGGDREQAARWLALGACRAGPPPNPRPTLVWDGQPGSGMASRLAKLGAGVEHRIREGVHGFSRPMAASSWAWMDSQLRGVERSDRDEERALSGTASAWQHVAPGLRPSWKEGTPGVGLLAQGAPPWDRPFSVTAARARDELGLGAEGTLKDPGVGWLGALEPHAIEVTRASATPDGRGWVVVLGPGPAPRGGPEFTASTAALGGTALSRLAQLDRSAAVAVLTPRPALDPTKDSSVTRWGLEIGKSPLGLATHDALAARDRLASLPEVVREKVGFIGIGAGGPAALWAAKIAGDDTPVVLAHAPVTLWWDGPRAGADGPLRPWPTWLLPSGGFGALVDPWMALEGMEGRVVWLDPRDGSARPWTRSESLPGRRVRSAREALSRRSP